MTELARKKAKLRDTEIWNIHVLALVDRPKDKGAYRRSPAAIAGAFTRSAQPSLIEPKLAVLLLDNEVRRRTMHPIERITRLHLALEGILHFIDGNRVCNIFPAF